MSHTSSLDYRNLPSYKPLFLDYLQRFETLSPFFTGDPFEPASWTEVASKLEALDQRPDTAIPLRALNQSLGADEAALASLDKLANGALVVITGQQVGVLGGPLYTLYKAMTAVRLARSAETLLNKKIVPLFWMDADDHDLAEVRQASILGRSQELIDLCYDAPEADARYPVGKRELSQDIDEVVDAARHALVDTDFKDDVLGALRESYTPGHTMAQAFGSWLLRMTRGTGLAIVDPTLPELKSLGAVLFEREVSEAWESSRLVEQTTEELLKLGYHAQASPTDSQLNLFYANPERHPLVSSESGFRLSSNGDVTPKDDVIRKIRDETSSFSPNVLLRPIYQDTLFATLAYVAGPSELAYFAQLRRLYEHFDVVMPLIATRASFTVIEPPQARFIDRNDVELTRLKSDDESLLNEILRRHTPPELDEDLTRARNCIQDITNALERDLASVDASLVSTVKSTRGKLLHHLKELESKSLRALKRKNETVRNQFLSTRSALFPGFEMQERRLSPLGFLNKYGWHFPTILEEGADPELKSHILLYP